MAKTNTDARWLPGADMEQSAAKIRDLLLALSEMLGDHNADEVKGLIQSIVELMSNDDDQSIGQQLTNAINTKASISALAGEISERKAAVTALDNKKVNNTDFNSYKDTTNGNISSIQNSTATNTNKLATVESGLNSANTSITGLENREKYHLTCLNGYVKFGGGCASANASKFSSCLIYAEKDCPNGLTVSLKNGDSMEAIDENGDVVPLQEGHLYVFVYIHPSDGSGDELRLAIDMLINTDGRHWFSGSEISHLENAKEYDIEGQLGDMYLNVESLRVYRCNGLSKNNLYEWAYIGQWQKTSDIKMTNLSAELQNIITSKAEKSAVDELSKSVQSLISRPSGGMGGENIVVDTKLDIDSYNTITNNAVSEEFSNHDYLITGIQNGLCKVLNIPYVPQITYDDNNPIYVSTESGTSLIDVVCTIYYPEIKFNIGSSSTIIPGGNEMISPLLGWEDFESAGCGTYEIWMTITRSKDNGCYIEFKPAKLADDESPDKETMIGFADFDSTSGNECICSIVVGSVELKYDEDLGSHNFINCNFYDISGAIFLNSSALDNPIDSALSESSINPVQNNVIKAALDEKVSNTQYATTNQAGLIKLHKRSDGTNISGINVDGTTGEAEINVVSAYGLQRTGDGKVVTAAATEAEIDAGTNNYKPIVPANLDYAVKKVVTTAENTYTTTPNQIGTWTDETPIWRVAYSGNFMSESFGYVTGDPDIGISALLNKIAPNVIDTINKIIPIKGFIYLRSFNTDDTLAGDLMCPLLGTGFYTGGADLTKYTNVDVWFEFVTPESNIV